MEVQRALSIADFCRRYSVSESLFYKLQREQKISTQKVGSKTLIGFDEAERWFNSLPKRASVAA